MDLASKLFKGDRVIWVIFMFLCLVSVIEVFSATSTIAYKNANHWAPIVRHATFLLGGFVLVLLMHNIPCRFYSLLSLLLPVSMVLLAITPFVGVVVNGEPRWLEILGIRFQPSEIAKIAAIGYISFGSLNDTVKALKVEGVEPSTATIESGDYKIVRPFNIAVKDGLSDAAQDFENYILSSEGQDIIEKAGYIKIDKSAAAYSSNNASGKVVVSGSSSVTPVMEKLAEAYQKANTNVTVDVQQSDSSTGIKDAINGTSDIGMASRELEDSEKDAGLTSTAIAMDGIAVIVNKDNKLDDISIDNVKKIYTGEITDWSDVK